MSQIAQLVDRTYAVFHKNLVLEYTLVDGLTEEEAVLKADERLSNTIYELSKMD